MNNQNTSKIGRFNVLALTKDQSTNHYLSDDLEYICLIPFERGADNSIKSIFVLDYESPANGETIQSLVLDTVNPDLDKTPFDSVCRALIEEAGLDIESLGITEDKIYYLGDIQNNVLASAKMHCFAVDLTSTNVLEFTRNLSKDIFIKDSSSIKKVGFHQVVSGDFSDSTILAGSFLLISYFN